MISVAASKISSWSKIESDCERCQETNRDIDILVYVTSGSPQASTQERWKLRVEEEFGWSLEVRTMDWLAPVASANSCLI
jgi:predicted nucleotidyltransferase